MGITLVNLFPQINRNNDRDKQFYLPDIETDGTFNYGEDIEEEEEKVKELQNTDRVCHLTADPTCVL